MHGMATAVTSPAAKTAAAPAKADRLLEAYPVQQANISVDRENHVIKGVKVIGLHSQWGYDYTPQALREAIGLYEGIRVNIDHHRPKSREDVRKFGDRFGRLKNIREAADGLYGDLQYLESHPLSAMAIEAAETMPDTIGLSHDADGTMSKVNGRATVTKIKRVRSVDLCYSTATGKGLFESAPEGVPTMDALSGEQAVTAPTNTPPEPPDEGGDSVTEAVKKSIINDLTEILSEEGDVDAQFDEMVSLLKKNKKVLKLLAATDKKTDDELPTDAPTQEAAPEDLKEKVRRLEADVQCRDLMAENGITDKPLLEALCAIQGADESDTKRLREALVAGWPKNGKLNHGIKPRSASQTVPLKESSPSDIPATDAKPEDKQSWLRRGSV